MIRLASAVVTLLMALAVVGCATPYQVVEFPKREADLYPLSQTRDDVSVAIDEIRSQDRVKRYFGANLTREGILPLAIVISNNSEHRLAVKPSDVLLHKGSQIIDPLPIETVVGMAKDEYLFLRAKTQTRVRRYFEGLAFRETVLSPGETYQGVMFFQIPRPQRHSDTFFTILSLFYESGLQVVVGTRDLETRQRTHFGPFPLSSRERTFDFE